MVCAVFSQVQIVFPKLAIGQVNQCGYIGTTPSNFSWVMGLLTLSLLKCVASALTPQDAIPGCTAHIARIWFASMKGALNRFNASHALELLGTSGVLLRPLTSQESDKLFLLWVPRTLRPAVQVTSRRLQGSLQNRWWYGCDQWGMYAHFSPSSFFSVLSPFSFFSLFAFHQVSTSILFSLSKLFPPFHTCNDNNPLLNNIQLCETCSSLKR